MEVHTDLDDHTDLVVVGPDASTTEEAIRVCGPQMKVRSFMASIVSTKAKHNAIAIIL